MVTRADKYTDRKTKEFASDFAVGFEPHPDTGDLLRITDEVAVKQAMRNLLLTNRMRRPYSSNLGVGIEYLLFEPATIDTANALKEQITEVITRHEPRVKLRDVNVIYLEQNNAYQVTITFIVINNTDQVKLDLILYRVR